MKAVCLVLIACVLAIAAPAHAQRAGAINDPDERLHFTEKDLPTCEKDPAGESEIDQFARGRELDYAAITRRAARGDMILERARSAKAKLERHEYYEKLKPTTIGDVKFESIHTLSRWYWITATITTEGKATLTWKLRKN